MILPRSRQIKVRLQKKRREPFTRSAFSTERSSWPWSLPETAFSIAWSECLPAHSFVLLHDERISAGLRSCSPPGEKARQTAPPQPEDSIWSALNTSDSVESVQSVVYLLSRFLGSTFPRDAAPAGVPAPFGAEVGGGVTRTVSIILEYSIDTLPARSIFVALAGSAYVYTARRESLSHDTRIAISLS